MLKAPTGYLLAKKAARLGKPPAKRIPIFGDHKPAGFAPEWSEHSQEPPMKEAFSC